MNRLVRSCLPVIMLGAGSLVPLNALAASSSISQPSALTCDDFRPTAAATERFPDLQGACEGVVERNGELYAKFVAIVRRASNRSVTLYLPATDHTFTINPDSTARVLLGNQNARIGDLARGQEIRIYLATSEFAKPDIEQIAMVTEDALLIVQPVTKPSVATLPTTASLLPGVGLTGVLLMLLGLASHTRSKRHLQPCNDSRRSDA